MILAIGKFCLRNHILCRLSPEDINEVPIMIKTLSISNFKAIMSLDIELVPFSVLIGGNSSGKSTVLQALDFIRAFATRDIDEYLLERGWLFDDLMSQFDAKPIGIEVGLELNISGTPQDIRWRMQAGYSAGKISTREIIQNNSKDETIISHGLEKPTMPEYIEKLFLKSSYIKLIDEKNPSPMFHEELYAIKKFFAHSSSYELLTPDRMREKTSRREATDIGLGGEQLAAYINSMPNSQKRKLNKILSEFAGYSVKATTKTKRPGWVDLFIKESFSATETKIKATHISDGLIRLIGLIATSLPNVDDDVSDSGFILLDEIEDGINPYLTEKVIGMLRTVVSDYDKQIILTTHSPVMLNHFEKNEIIFMWRDDSGFIHAQPMFDTEGMKDTLDCFNPGEVWLNYSKDEIIELMNSSQTEG